MGTLGLIAGHGLPASTFRVAPDYLGEVSMNRSVQASGLVPDVGSPMRYGRSGFDANPRGSLFEIRRKMGLQSLHHLAEDFRSGGENVAGVEPRFISRKIADQAPGFLNQ